MLRELVAAATAAAWVAAFGAVPHHDNTLMAPSMSAACHAQLTAEPFDAQEEIDKCVEAFDDK